MKTIWNENEVNSQAGMPLPKDLCETRYSTTIGKTKLSFGTRNKRLSCFLGGHMTFKGGKGDQGYFKDVEEMKLYVERFHDDFLKAKTMNKLIYVGL